MNARIHVSIYTYQAEMATRQAATARTEKARLYVTARLSSDEGLRLQKHGRNGKTTSRTLRSPDPDFQTLTWGKTLHDLRSMQEVRLGGNRGGWVGGEEV